MAAPEPFSRIITDETLLENVRHGSPAFPLQYYYENIWDFDFHCVDWHWHPELEYVYVQSGQAICFVGKEKKILNTGCGMLINSRVIHRFEAGASTVIPNVVYSPFLLAAENSLIYLKYLQPFISSRASCVLFNPAVPWQAVCIQRMMRLVPFSDPDMLLHICFICQNFDRLEPQTRKFLEFLRAFSKEA